MDFCGKKYNPLDARCDSFKDTCCRLPEWKDVPHEKEFIIPKRPPTKCIEELRQRKNR